MNEASTLTHPLSETQRAFSKQSDRYDEFDAANFILTNWRKRVYQHVNKYMRAGSHILELNSGTGIDALYFSQQGHTVYATDASPGMVSQIRKKIEDHHLQHRLRCQQCSFEELDLAEGKKFDYVFSNFGGLNCSKDLRLITGKLDHVLNDGAYISWVIMPKVSLWELLWIVKGSKHAFRRLKKNGRLAHVEGHFFNTYYYSLSQIKKAFHKDFVFIKAEGLGAVSPPPGSEHFAIRHKKIAGLLSRLDFSIRNIFPFNRWADHIIVTFQYRPTRHVR